MKGSKTDIAMLEFLAKCGINIDESRDKYLSKTGYLKFPFSSARKRQSTVVELGEGRKRMHVKGASEFVLESCTQWHSFSNDLVSAITPQMRVNLETIIERNNFYIFELDYF